MSAILSKARDLKTLQALDEKAKKGEFEALMQMAKLFEEGLFYKPVPPRHSYDVQREEASLITSILDGDEEDNHRDFLDFDVGPVPRKPDYIDAELGKKLREIAEDTKKDIKSAIESYKVLRILNEKGEFHYLNHLKARAMIVGALTHKYAGWPETPAVKHVGAAYSPQQAGKDSSKRPPSLETGLAFKP